jgi:hypothetical protein
VGSAAASTLPGVESAAEPTRSKAAPADPGQGPVDVPPGGAEERADALPVLANGPSVVRPYPRPASPAVREARPSLPVVQAVAAAAGGFVAGAALVGLVGRHHRRAAAPAKGRRAPRGPRTGRGGRSAGGVGELVQIVGSRSLLVDVHLLGDR